MSLNLGSQEGWELIRVSRFQGFTCHDYIIISDLFWENANNCKNGEEAHKETIRAYGAMGFLKLE